MNWYAYGIGFFYNEYRGIYTIWMLTGKKDHSGMVETDATENSKQLFDIFQIIQVTEFNSKAKVSKKY